MEPLSLKEELKESRESTKIVQDPDIEVLQNIDSQKTQPNNQEIHTEPLNLKVQKVNKGLSLNYATTRRRKQIKSGRKVKKINRAARLRNQIKLGQFILQSKKFKRAGCRFLECLNRYHDDELKSYAYDFTLVLVDVYGPFHMFPQSFIHFLRVYNGDIDLFMHAHRFVPIRKPGLLTYYWFNQKVWQREVFRRSQYRGNNGKPRRHLGC